MSEHGAASILHVDMDAFYASVEERENPGLKGKPLAVGGSPDGRGVVAAANYAARDYGVHSAMPASQARRLCPKLIFLRSRMDLYAAISGQIKDIFARYTPLIEPLSLDEAFLDVAASGKLFGEPMNIAQSIKRDILSELELVASVGVAPNKFLAKLASDLSKPDGLLEVPADDIDAFLSPLAVSRIWGVGAAAERKLRAMGIYTVADLRAEDGERLESRLGAWGKYIWDLAHGRDARVVTPERRAKSISHETTFSVDIDDKHGLRTILLGLAEQVCRRLRTQQRSARTVELKIRYGDFTTVTRAHSLAAPTDRTRTIWREGSALFETQWVRRSDPVRLIGFGVSGFGADEAAQTDLFEAPRDDREKKLDGVMDEISARFGKSAVGRGSAGTRK